MGARGVLWLAALLGAALAAGGLWLAESAIQAGVLHPLRAGCALLMLVLGAAACAAGFYAANHSRLSGGRLTFDAAARSLLASPSFSRCLRWGGHAVGITVLVVSWLSYFYPAGFPLH
jgi:hypothetical protein